MNIGKIVQAIDGLSATGNQILVLLRAIHEDTTGIRLELVELNKQLRRVSLNTGAGTMLRVLEFKP